MRNVCILGLLFAALGACVSPTAIETPDEVVDNTVQVNKELRAAFRQSYKLAIDSHQAQLMSDYPIITQDLLNMTLWIDGRRAERYRMRTEKYFLMAGSSHPPIAVYSLLSKYRMDSLTDEALEELVTYQDLVRRMIASLPDSPLSKRERQSVRDIMRQTDEYIARVVERRRTTLEEYEAYAKQTVPAIQYNFSVGAGEQLVQFREQIGNWKKQYPDERWADLRVVVMGFHQARDQYALRQFFDWLLQEPNYEKRVVFAEFQGSIFGASRANAEQQALNLLTKVDFDLDASSAIFGHPKVLQQDVMGPAATEILEALPVPEQ